MIWSLSSAPGYNYTMPLLLEVITEPRRLAFWFETLPIQPLRTECAASFRYCCVMLSSSAIVDHMSFYPSIRPKAPIPSGRK